MYDHRSCVIFNKCISGYPGPQDSSNNCYDLHFINCKNCQHNRGQVLGDAYIGARRVVKKMRFVLEPT